MAKPGDDAQRSLIKIVDLLGGGGGGGGGSATLIGSGDPAPGAGVVGQFYWDETNKLLFVKDASDWNIH